MAVKSKTQLQTDIAASTFAAGEQVILDDIVDSYENVFSHVTTVQRDALTPSAGDIVYNTDNDRYEYWNGSSWFGIGQDLSTPLVVKIDLTSAQILALNATPVTVASALGAGFAFDVHRVAWRFTYATAQYANGADICIRNSTKSNTDRYGYLNKNEVLSASNTSGTVPMVSSNTTDPIIDNDDLVLSCASAFTAGGGTLTLWITYSIITY